MYKAILGTVLYSLFILSIVGILLLVGYIGVRVIIDYYYALGGIVIFILLGYLSLKALDKIDLD